MNIKASLILGAGLLLSGIGAPVTHAASDATISLGSLVHEQNAGYLDLPIMLASPDQAVSAITVKVSYSNNLEFIGASFTDSSFPQEITAPHQSAGAVTFSRARFDTGYKGASSSVGMLKFLPIRAGDASVTLQASGSQVIAYSDDGDNILSKATVAPATYTITASEVQPEISQASATPTTDPSPNSAKNKLMLTDWHNPLVWVGYGVLAIGVILLLLAGISYWRRRRTGVSTPGN